MSSPKQQTPAEKLKQGKWNQLQSKVSKLEDGLKEKLDKIRRQIMANNFLEALQLLSNLERAGYVIPDVILLKGRIYFYMNELEQALECFQDVVAKYPTTESMRCLRRCQAALSANNSRQSIFAVNIEPRNQLSIQITMNQTEDEVIVNLLADWQEIKPIKVDIYETAIDIFSLKKEDFKLHYELFDKIVPDASKHVFTPISITLTLKKACKIEWRRFDKVAESAQ